MNIYENPKKNHANIKESIENHENYQKSWENAENVSGSIENPLKYKKIKRKSTNTLTKSM